MGSRIVACLIQVVASDCLPMGRVLKRRKRQNLLVIPSVKHEDVDLQLRVL